MEEQCEVGYFFFKRGSRKWAQNNLLSVVRLYNCVNHGEEAPLAGELDHMHIVARSEQVGETTPKNVT